MFISVRKSFLTACSHSTANAEAYARLFDLQSVAPRCPSSQCRELWDDKLQRSFPFHVFPPSLTVSHSPVCSCNLHLCLRSCTFRMTPSLTHPAAYPGPWEHRIPPWLGAHSPGLFLVVICNPLLFFVLHEAAPELLPGPFSGLLLCCVTSGPQTGSCLRRGLAPLWIHE